ncbi:MAG: hypothetical protein QOH43_3274 [Solirubrobacteraceae bacterium]|nr:hypothetical protein [Solirubrobacteraceae bacterium]
MRPRRIPLGAEVALAFSAGAAAFALMAVIAAVIASDVVTTVAGLVCVLAVVAIARVGGIAYAAPAAFGALIAYDWYAFPPTHDGFPDTTDVADLFAYLAVAVLVGELAAHAGRRADVSEVARSELVEDQAALRRVATLVARGSPPDEVFAAVGLEVGMLLEVDGARVIRYAADDEVEQLDGWSAPGQGPLPVGRIRPAGTSAASEVRRTGRVARVDDDVPGVGAVVGAPIVVGGRLWGAVVAWCRHRDRLPDAAEARLADFTDLVATAVANSASRQELARLADEQAALRRVATLVASGVPAPEVFAAVTRELGQLLGVDVAHMGRYERDDTAVGVGSWSRAGDHIPVGTRASVGGKSVSSLVLQTGRPARIDDYDAAGGPIAARLRRELGIRSSVGAPIAVDGRLWGVMVASSKEDEPLPADTESRIAAFTQLVATAISNAEARAQLGRLADEQAALRRVATLVAQGVPPGELLGAVAEEVGRLLGADIAAMTHYDSEDTVTAVATWAAVGEHADVGARWPLDGGDLAVRIARTGRPARIDDYAGVEGRIAAFLRDELGITSSVASPIVVEGRLWGALDVHSTKTRPLPADTESRLTNFTELVATAMSNAQARADVHRLADEQAALRRVATLVARDVPQPEVFAAVAREVGHLLGVDATHMARYDAAGTATGVAGWGGAEPMPVGTQYSLEGESVSARVLRTGRAARMYGYGDASGPAAAAGRRMGLCSSVGAPIVVQGSLWGVIIASSKGEQELPLDTESRLAAFTELVVTAISNTEARADVHRLADEQAALRRVATLVAHESPPAQVFAAVAAEVGRLLHVEHTELYRYEPGSAATIVADWGEPDGAVPAGTRVTLEGENVAALVLRTGRPARLDEYAKATGSVGSHARELGIRSAVGAPILVQGRLWGAIVAGSRQAQPLPAGTESRIGEFTELVATAVSNVQARSDLATSRARIVAATDDERRRVVRDLHDGAQQRLVHTIITLKLARRALDVEDEAAPALVTEALQHVERAMVELRELAHGILPAVLTRGGLRAGVDALASRMPVPVENGVAVDRLPAAVEATAYFVVAEALTNVAKHARAEHAAVTADFEGGTLAVRVRDDGVGGARPDGSGLLGLGDRLAVLEGRLRIESPADGGTLNAATIPLPGR